MPEVEKTSIFGTAVHVILKTDGASAAGALRAHLERAGVSVTSIAPVPPSLEDVFLALTGEGGEA